MAQQGFTIDSSKLCCSVCLDLLKDPVTIPCGHNYCMNCIKRHWDEEDQKAIYSCPQCRHLIIPRPALVKNTMLADLVEELKQTGFEVFYCGPGDVACDICTGRKLKAVKSCLHCVGSYCEHHLQPHYDFAALKKHKLVDPSEKPRENICPHHHDVMKSFCHTDQQCICYLCSADEHRGHCIVSAEAERTERQRELKPCRERVHTKILEREEDVKVLLHEVEAINQSADKAVRDSEKIFSELIHLIEKRSSDIKQQIRYQQEAEVNWAKELLERMADEVTDLRRKDAELEKLSRTGDHTRFLRMFPLLSDLSESTEVPRPKPRPLLYFDNVAAAVSEVKDKLRSVLCEGLQTSLTGSC